MLAAGLVPALAVAAVAGGRQPGTALLATAPTQPGAGVTGGASLPPVEARLPGPREIRVPASLSRPTVRVGETSLRTIPATALAAYQQASAVIDTADLSCHLDWTLLAAIGQVESDHGRTGGSHLDQRGVAEPGIIGPRLDGHHGTALVRDTDAGRLDHDTHFDHAVGPMQFLPSTWAVVAVDGDGDGRRNVQDIGDAALGSAVYLCAGHDDLATRAGSKAALLRYNHSTAYVATVLAIARGLRTSSLFGPVTTTRTVSSATPTPQPQAHHTTTADPPPPIVVTDPTPPSVPTTAPTTEPTGSPTTAPTGSPSTSPTASVPTSTATAIPTASMPTEPGSPTPSGPTTDPTTDPTSAPPTTDPTAVPPSETPTGDPEAPVIPDPLPPALADLTTAQVTAFDAAWPACLARLPDPWTRHDVRRILAAQLDLPRHDRGLRVFARWVTRHEHRAGRHPSPSAP